jgi:hypothetical protein
MQNQPKWSVLVRGVRFVVQANDIDSARSRGMLTAMKTQGWRLNDVFCATPTDQIRRIG